MKWRKNIPQDNEKLKINDLCKLIDSKRDQLFRSEYSKSIENIARSGAISVAIKNVESAKATDYENLTSYSLKVEENRISYDVNVEVIPFDEIDYTYEDIVKKINVSVKYNVDGKAHEYSLTGLKGKVMPSE